MDLSAILSMRKPPTLLIGNGINRHGQTNGGGHQSWEGLLQKIAGDYGIALSKEQLEHMSSTERYDILDLARPIENRDSLQKKFCELMADWAPHRHHKRVISWAKQHKAPVITVNFDELLSQSVDAEFVRPPEGFTDYYPWRCHFSDHRINDAASEFAIWHAHGMARYSRSVRLGLTHYMGSVQRARGLIYGKGGLRDKKLFSRKDWVGQGTWLEPFFFSPLLVLGFGFEKDETFLRWLFMERARFYRVRPDQKTAAWFVQKIDDKAEHRKRFLDELGIQSIYVKDYPDIYDIDAWLM